MNLPLRQVLYMLIDDISIGAKFCPEAILSPCTEVER